MTTRKYMMHLTDRYDSQSGALEIGLNAVVGLQYPHVLGPMSWAEAD